MVWHPRTPGGPSGTEAGFPGTGRAEAVPGRTRSIIPRPPADARGEVDVAATTERTVPEGMPERFEGPSAWIGSDLAGQPDVWRHALTGNEIREPIRAAERYLSTGRGIGEIDAREFPLPEFGAEVGAMKRELLAGVGFAC